MKLAALAVILLWTGMPLRAELPAAKPDSLVTAFVDAWNAHEPAAFGELFASDADWVTASGLRLHGRERIQAFLAEEHAGWARRTRMRSLSIQVRELGTETAAIFFEWEIAGDSNEAGTASPPRRGNNLFVATRSGSGWTIAAGQVARKPPPT